MATFEQQLSEIVDKIGAENVAYGKDRVVFFWKDKRADLWFHKRFIKGDFIRGIKISLGIEL